MPTMVAQSSAGVPKQCRIMSLQFPVQSHHKEASDQLDQHGELNMEKNVREIFERIEKRLNDIEELGKELKNGIDEISTEMAAADHASGVGAKLDRILQLLESKK